MQADRILRAIGFIVLSMACFSVLNGLSKLLIQHYAVSQAIWARYVFSFVLMLAVFLPGLGPNLFRVRRLGNQVVRGLLLFFSSYLYFHGLVYLPLSTAAAISLSSPIIVTALSVPFLGEPVGARRWAAVGVGFLGAMVVVRPGSSGFDWHALLIIASTTCSAFYQLYTRRYGQHERPEASATIATIVGTLASTPFLPFEWKLPAGLGDTGLFVALGALAGVGHYFLTRAYSDAPAAVIAPFNYVQLVGAAIIGYLLFAEVPDAWTWAGATVIVASGLYIGHRERVRRREAEAKRRAQGQ